MKRTMSIVVFYVIIILTIMPASIAYAQDVESIVVELETLTQVTDRMSHGE